jgi:ATP-dependent helicase YprA (DUF1998 family)
LTTTETPTVGQTIEEIRASLRDYIEATYHIGHPTLIRQRHELLQEPGAIAQVPYLESTPRYEPGERLEELGLPDAATELLTLMAGREPGQPGLLFNPPYRHQAIALQEVLGRGHSLVVTTGTGSGKTESFLLPILGKLAAEAKHRPASFQAPAVRAIVLYPMNALVNDQLGRLRLMLGNDQVAGAFKNWAARPARFARYTSRTLYPGVRTVKKDQDRLKPIGQFYVALLDQTDVADGNGELARSLIEHLKARGKWPAKSDLRKWYGAAGSRWQKDGSFVRAVTLPDDAELFTRHEVLLAPPDVLVTNYSMLEYMLMRPLERPIFDATRTWLHEHPEENLLLVIDEGHLYRGAAGAEVGLLLRRLRARLDLPPERLQVICTSASFSDPANAQAFAAALTGKEPEDFTTVVGTLALRPNPQQGTREDAEVLAAVSLDGLYESDEAQRLEAVKSFLEFRGVDASGPIDELLFDALRDYPPMSLLVNLTMQEALPLAQLGAAIFADVLEPLAEQALTALIAVGSSARRTAIEPGLLPCRIHSFFRGLPGLWACLDSECGSLPAELRGGPVGRLFAQPRELCSCGARVFELYTCRNCGSAYARAYTDNISQPSFLWLEPGSAFQSVGGPVGELQPLDLCLEEPMPDGVEPADLDLVTGRLNPGELGDRTRRVFMRRDRTGNGNSEDEDESSGGHQAGGEFRPCGVCGQQAAYGRSSVQDHQTKGDQPFQALVTRQIQVQPPGRQPYTEFAPLRGRKVLAFSDSRQAAARLAPNLQTYSMQDVLRPLILVGLRELHGVEMLKRLLSLEDLYLAVLIGARFAEVRLRPELRAGESMQIQRDVEAAAARGELSNPDVLHELFVNARAEAPPASLLRGLVRTITDRWYGLQSLALASLAEREGVRQQLLDQLPPFGPLAETDEQRLALVRLWIGQWIGPGVWFPKMPPSWWATEVRSHKGKFKPITQWLGEKQPRQAFEKTWLPVLLSTLCEPVAGSHRIRAAQLTLDIGPGWGYCKKCRTTQRPFPQAARCIACSRDTVQTIDPDDDPVFSARKGYYRQSAVRALAKPPERPMAIVAAEHTAQLNVSQADDVFSKAEEHELLFQDVDLGPTSDGRSRTAIDVLSCTTTMEVGIDIGTLSGVALRNIPPSRASYQQRSGRAGRRGTAVATVTAFGSADSHDEHYFAEPDAMIRGRVDDPILSLDNAEIARRHITAFLFQRYLADRLPEIDPEEQPQLFEVLGKVKDFLTDKAPLNRRDFGDWLHENGAQLRSEVDVWLPRELSGSARSNILDSLVTHTLSELDKALGIEHVPEDRPESVSSEVDELKQEEPEGVEEAGEESSPDEPEGVEAPEEAGEEHTRPDRAAENLLDRLLYKGVLPRYAFPTDVVGFHIFDSDRSTRFRPVFRYAPNQGLPVALTQYAPGKEVWVDGKLWTSGALYSPVRSDRFLAWSAGQLYFECSVCHYAKTESRADAEKDELRNCPACGAEDKFGKARNWIRPPGFAHPHTREEGTSPDDQPAQSYATRAKLVAPGPAEEEGWSPITDRLRQYYKRTFLLVTNSGPRHEGYTYCLRCGLIEPTAIPSNRIFGPHLKPYPDPREPQCPGGLSTRGLVLGTDFVSDVLLVSVRVDEPLTLRPGYLASDVALRTLAEALTIAATKRLEIEPGELQAEYRPALTDLGKKGLESEIYLYDTLPGGAGFSRRVADLGISIFEESLQLLEQCPEGCDRSCYRCLRSFRNRFEHDLLDRYLGASLLRYLLYGEEPVLDQPRLEQASDRVFEDLRRQALPGVEFARNAPVEIEGLGVVQAPILATTPTRRLIVGIHGPLTPDFPADEALRDAKEFAVDVPVEVLDEIVVTRNLPAASLQVIQRVSP